MLNTQCFTELLSDTSRNYLCNHKKNNPIVLFQKKSRLDVSSSEVANITCDSAQILLDTIYISSDENNKSNSSKPKKNAKNGEGSAENKIYSGPRARLLPVRRGRNIERRKASTKRWVERKKALIASIGETVSDTDSIASDDVQLSPVQKARAKTNADKELERQKKVAKVLKSLETNLTEKYVAFRDKDTDSDTRRTRLSKEAHSNALQQKNKNSLLNQIGKKSIIEKYGSSLDSSMEMDNSSTPLTNNVALVGHAINSNVQADEQAFTPHSVQSEIVIDDVTYAVTSTLILTADSSNYDQMDLYNLMKDSKSLSPDESNRQKNTDIIKAVNLCPVPNAKNKSNSKFRKSKSNNKFVERCMKIEVEGNELALLKRLQFELADFVEKEMKHKLFDTSDDVAKINNMDSGITGNVTYLYQNLNKTLKSMIESNIKKNIESSIVSQVDDACGQGSTKISPMLAKMVANLPRYQPKIMVKRLDIAKENKHYNINNAHALMPSTPRGKLAGPFSAITRKRQSVLPVRYGDYNVSALDSDSDALDNDDDYDEYAIQETPKTTKSKTSNMVTRQSAVVIDKPKENKQNEQKGNYEDSMKIEGAIAENHICGVCGLTFPTRKDVEIHVRTHKITLGVSACTVVLPNENATSPQKPRPGKQKMKRCKRCHEIVEARFVKSHVCKTALHKCYVCDSMFRTKNLLAKHLESHDHSEFNIINAIENKKFNNADTLLKILSVASTSPQKDQAQETETTIKMPTGVNDKNDIQSDKISSTGVKLDSAENVMKKPKETYTCFVCDKIFTDEEILKDHLQKHCDDLSEGEQSNSKEQYQCAICGNILESDQALEEHVSKHLFDDEDDNPNLISIDQNNDNKANKDNKKSKENETYQCGQCSETFDSEMLLEMHMQAHEEEVAIAEWEKQGMYQYQCSLCDELCDTEEELAEHFNIHNANAQVCQLCDKPFRTLEDLQEHVATH